MIENIKNLRIYFDTVSKLIVDSPQAIDWREFVDVCYKTKIEINNIKRRL